MILTRRRIIAGVLKWKLLLLEEKLKKQQKKNHTRENNSNIPGADESLNEDKTSHEDSDIFQMIWESIDLTEENSENVSVCNVV